MGEISNEEKLDSMKFIITIDTEGDNQWDHGRELTVENIKYVPRFQELCRKYGISPVYLVTSEICNDTFARELFTDYIKKGVAEIGAHLHSWTAPPFLDNDGFRENDPDHAFASELPYDLLIQKLAVLTRKIEDSFSKRPTSFRSGRYGFNENVAKALVENGYLVDSSVTPYVSWKEQTGIPNGPGGPDFIGYRPTPFRYNLMNGSLAEIPVTIMPTRFPLTLNHNLAVNYFKHVNNNLILRVLRKLYFSNQPVWLRPVPGTDLNLLRELLNVAGKIQLPFITMMFHSSELMPGCSKYRPDEASVEELYALLEGLFKSLSAMDITSVTLTEAAENHSL
jgi:hypothetical protein